MWASGSTCSTYFCGLLDLARLSSTYFGVARLGSTYFLGVARLGSTSDFFWKLDFLAEMQVSSISHLGVRTILRKLQRLHRFVAHGPCFYKFWWYAWWGLRIVLRNRKFNDFEDCSQVFLLNSFFSSATVFFLGHGGTQHPATYWFAFGRAFVQIWWRL